MAAKSHTAEFEGELERERARWVRRRFLWLMGVTLALSMPMLPALWLSMEADGTTSGMTREAGLIRFWWATLAVGIYLLAMVAVIVKVNRPGSARFASRLALALMSLTGLLTVPIERIAAGLEGTLSFEVSTTGPEGTTRPSPERKALSEFMAGFQAGAGLGEAQRQSSEGRANGSTKPTTQTTRPALQEGQRIVLRPGFEFSAKANGQGGAGGSGFNERLLASVWTPGLRTALMAVWVAVSVHLLACLFMPWTVRESLVPAAAIGTSFAIVVAADLMVGQITWFWVALIVPALVSALVPGTALCWWRYSRFRGEYRLQFESERYQELRTELSAARRIHDSSLPPQITTGPVHVTYAYRPMRDIGGDLLVSREWPDGRRLIVLVDVTGHGITAALTVNRLLGELDRLLAQQRQLSPAAVLAGLNRYTRLMLAHHALYLSAVVLVIDPVGRTLCYASGGHPTGHIARRDGTTEDLESTATLLGVLPPDHYDAEEREVRLDPGDVVFFCTDGATESRQADGTMLRTAGMRRLFEEVARSPTIPPDRVADALMLRLISLRPGEDEDDTLLVCACLPTDG